MEGSGPKRVVNSNFMQCPLVEVGCGGSPSKEQVNLPHGGLARGESHRAGWDWYNAEEKKYAHLGIQHETYLAPPVWNR